MEKSKNVSIYHQPIDRKMLILRQNIDCALDLARNFLHEHDRVYQALKQARRQIDEEIKFRQIREPFSDDVCQKF